MPSVGCGQILHGTRNVGWSEELAGRRRKAGVRIKGQDHRWVRRETGEGVDPACAETINNLSTVSAVRVGKAASSGYTRVHKRRWVSGRIPELSARQPVIGYASASPKDKSVVP